MGEAEHAQLLGHRYFRIPSTLWTQGYMPQLNGPGLAMLLVLLYEARGTSRPVWFSPRIAQERFALAPSTRTAGLKQLRDLKVLTTEQKVISEDGRFISVQRRRNVHTVTLDRGPENSSR